MVKFLAIGNIRHGRSEFSGQDLTKAPCVVKRMEIDEEFVMGGMDYCSFDLRCRLSVLSACVVNHVPALSAFAVMLSIKNERDILVDGGKGGVESRKTAAY